MWIAFLVVVTAAVSYGVVNIQSSELRGWLGALIAVAFLMGLQSFLMKEANKDRRQHHHKKLTYFDLIVTSEDNSYSLSRFQIYIWTVWVVIAFAQVAFATLKFPIIPDAIAGLLGINAFTTVLSTALTDVT
jgi:hypothetical protein